MRRSEPASENRTPWWRRWWMWFVYLGIVGVGIYFVSTWADEYGALELIDERGVLYECGVWHNDVEKIIKRELVDPDSFEWRDRGRYPSTGDVVLGPVDKDGRVSFAVNYRARNSAGGYSLGVARGNIDVNDCSLLLIYNDF